MSLLTKVGSLTKPGVTGAQAITGLGFQPKAIIFWTSGSSAASGTWAGTYMTSIGFTTGPANSYACAASSADGSTASIAGRRMAAKAITISDSAGSSADEADLISLDVDGFTLNWTAVANTAASIVVHYMALGGTDITGAKVVNWTTPTAIGNKAVTGVGFKPDLVFNAEAVISGALSASSGGASYFGFGVVNKAGQQWSNAIFSGSGVNPSNTSRWQQTDADFIQVDQTETTDWQSHFVSMDADGFTNNFSTTIATAYNIISLCLKGVSSKIGAFAKTTAAAPAAQSITRTGFTPKAVLLSSINTGVQNSPSNTANFSLGASDGATQRGAALLDRDNVSPTQAQSVWINNGSYYEMNAGTPPTIASLGSISSLDTDGFTLGLNPNFADSPEILYLALGDAGVDTFPSAVSA